MLRTFTRNDQLQEQYRLQEEWLRVQRTEEYARQKLQQDYAHVLKMKEQAEKERSQAFFIIQEKDAALQKKDQEIIRLKQMLESKLDGTTS